ncbi:type VI secretion system-associated protein [Vibrio coralliilyticus]|uniref:type VI secretion system contractile sheath small subunit n=1 Tax=Vibrio coralliilyticus TaxID=190893 RepID=UPI00081095FF|nr:type VI secretion system contractile sheath small subunit [Vibrio coralliilyticus]ANW22855.1 type VI secretion system-associated protein [Vibrio coralliilyticus]
MSGKGAVAPKERVNIVYRPATGDASEDVELPLKMLVVGDFTNKDDDRPVEEREPININKDNFDDVLRAQGINMQLSVPRRLAGADEDEKLEASLKIRGMKDFEPDQIIHQVPELQKLLELREALKALKGPLSNVPEFRKKLQELIHDDDSRDTLLREIGLDEFNEKGDS